MSPNPDRPSPASRRSDKGAIVVASRALETEVRVGFFADIDADNSRVQQRLREHLDILQLEPAARGRVAAFEHDRVCPGVGSIRDRGVVPARVRHAGSGKSVGSVTWTTWTRASNGSLPVTGVEVVDRARESDIPTTKGFESETSLRRPRSADPTYISLRMTLELFGLP